MCASLLTSPMFFELAFEVGSAPTKKINYIKTNGIKQQNIVIQNRKT